MRARTALIFFASLLLAQWALAVFALIGGYVFLIIFTLIIALASGTFFATTAYSVFFGAPFVPTDTRHVEAMLRLADIKPGDRLVDLGSGDGRIVIAAAKAGALAEGWEINPFLWLISKWKISRAGVADRARANLGSYWNDRFDDADIVTLFLITMQMPRMEKKLRNELRPGSRVVSYAFSFPEWPMERKEEGVFLYKR